MEHKPIDWTLEDLLVLAENGEKNVQYAIGFYYENGIHTCVNHQAAVEWYEKAAGQGHPEAQLHLGLLCAQGKDAARIIKRLFRG